MTTLERLLMHLEERELEPVAMRFSYFDLAAALRQTLNEFEAELPRRIAGARVNKREGQAELATLRHIYELVKKMDLLYFQESAPAAARLAANKPAGH